MDNRSDVFPRVCDQHMLLVATQQCPRHAHGYACTADSLLERQLKECAFSYCVYISYTFRHLSRKIDNEGARIVLDEGNP